MQGKTPEQTELGAARAPTAERRWAAVARSLPKPMSALAFLLASVTLLGWLLDVPALTSLLPGRVSTKPNSAIALLFASLSLWRISSTASLTQRRVATALAALPGVLGGITLVEYAIGADFGIDQLLFQEPSNAIGTSSPGRMAPNAAVAFIALSIALASLSHPRKVRRSALWLAGLTFFIAILALTGYLYGVEPLYGVALYTRMALSSSLGLLALSLGALCLRPDHGFMATLTGDSQSGLVARMLLPVGFIIPLGAGWLRLTGQRADLYGVEFGAALTAISSVLLVTLVILWTTGVLREQEVGRLRAEHERDRSHRELERLELERGLREQFVRAVTHDLRNPLTAGRTRAELIHMRPNDAAKCRVHAAHIIEAIDRTDHMIRDMLDASRLRAGHRLALRLERFQLPELIREVAEELSMVHGDRFVLRLEDMPPVFLSRSDVRRLLENLVTNAIKYGEPERPIALTLRRRGDRVLLAVHNYGKAMAADELASLFQPFYRAKSAQVQKGWGIGLTLVKGIVEAHGGHVAVDSAPAKGTTFMVELPLEARDDSVSGNDGLRAAAHPP